MSKRLPISTLVIVLFILTLAVSVLEIHSMLEPKTQAYVSERQLIHVTVEGESMMPTLTHGQVLIGDGSEEAISSVLAGDIILMKDPDAGGAESFLIKRVVGVAGDIVEIRHGKLYVNGFYKNYGGRFLDDYGPYTVEEASVFVLGDNPPNSLDSRFFKKPSVLLTEIVGKILLEE